MLKKMGKNDYMTIKIDLAKAYDRVEWKILLLIMQQLGLGEHIRELIYECLAMVRFSILINGAPYGYFNAERGLHQGDPISPALFTIYSNLLSHLLSREEKKGIISGIKVSRTSPKITHLMCTDDLVVYYKADREEAKAVVECLKKYCS